MNGNGNKRSDLERERQDFALTLKAADIVEVARCMSKDEAKAFVVDILRELVRSKPVACQSITSGFMAKAANHAVGTCECGQVNRVFRHPKGHLTCANCLVDDILAFRK